MNAKRKPKVQPETIAAPTEVQMDEAMCAFEKAKLRHQLLRVGDKIAVRILPDMMLPTAEFIGVKVPPLHNGPVPADIGYSIKYFADEPSARQWREREIIREAVTAGLRASR
ncbi:hypothetical protein [Bradyrhizobium sp. sGM-13]|uniref:hypothetical protein n=1 Tax=Bradyrhizobium sp. sGM-13 TaxID=2831781 RepID=UPI001BCD122E|nr:hypothetical protein [Bradyrhizobium sp. sGM-13]